MFITKIKNADGEMLTLSENTDKYVVASIIGLNPPKAQVNITNLVGADGGMYNSSFMGTRNIVITLMLRGDQEAARKELMEYFRSKGLCTFYFQNGNINAYIEGYVESIEYNIFQRTEEMQISIICPDPYFHGLTQYVIPMTGTTPLFNFEFAIDADDPVELSTYDSSPVTTIMNDSQADSGLTFVAKFVSSASSISFQNLDTWESVNLSYSFLADDILMYSTMGDDVVFTLERGASIANMFPNTYLGDVDIMTIHPGENNFGYSIDNSNNSSKADLVLIYRSCYQGV